MNPLVIYHANCTDGFGAAFAAWKKLGDEAEYVPAQYGDFVPSQLDCTADLSERDIYILDFSFPRERMEFLFNTAKRVVWLDHHKTAFEMWCGKYEKGMQWLEGGVSSRHIVLDDNKSGALLAWEYFHPDTEIPRLIQHIDDRDRWQFRLEGSKELHAALASYRPWSFRQWDDWICGYGHFTLTDLINQGEAIFRAQEQVVQQIVGHAGTCVIGLNRIAENGSPGAPWKCVVTYGWFDGYAVYGLAVNSPTYQSEVGHELANQSGTFGLAWYLAKDNKVRCSFRSNGSYDVSAIAKVFGGGGHRTAAGCEVSIETLLDWLK